MYNKDPSTPEVLQRESPHDRRRERAPRPVRDEPMTRFVGRRLLQVFVTIFAVVLIAFVFGRLAGSPAAQLLPENATQEQRDALNAELGFDRPVIAQFGDYLGGLLRGDFQNSYRETGTSSMAATAAAATQRGVMVRLHCLQSPREDGLLRERYGIGVVDALERTGLLDASLLIPHGSQLGDLRDPAVVAGPDVQRLVAVGVPIIHCPLTSARYGGGLRSFEAYRAAGLRMVLGSDSFPPDLLRGIDVGVQVAKILGGAWRRGGWRATCAPPPATPPTPSVDPTWVGSRSGRAPIS